MGLTEHCLQRTSPAGEPGRAYRSPIHQTIMSGKKSQEKSCSDNKQIEDPSRPEVEVPVNYVYRLLQEEQYTPCLGSTTSDFLLAMLDYLTDYILEVVGSEANINSQQNISQERERQSDNDREPPQAFKNTPFSLFDEMPGPRRNG
ncbi:huntingtin-interacting protein M [Mastomys coucha]|uniref:huntingtin-interacting protein M n=1 Tax=Mastomys coucha TaxID=35658 RepID=UPI00126240F4|nr:huntingtin-interacting protein M [Mastomys coucha]